jgi:glutaredoxin-like protein
MALLSEKDRKYLETEFEEKLKDPVKLVVFTQTIACDFCRETEQIAREVAELSPKLSVEVYNFVTDKAVAVQYGVDKIPATVVVGARDYGVRFYGVPAGYEFTTLIEDILDVSAGESGLSAEAKELLARIQTPVTIQVFVTPTCPYCPSAVSLAHKMAIENENIRGEMVESIEFPHLAHRYNVMGVPRIVINDKISIDGAVPESIMVDRVMEAAGLVIPKMVDEAVPPEEL